MDFQSLVKEFQTYGYASRAKHDNAEQCYALWAAQQHSADSTSSTKGACIANEIDAIRREIKDVLSTNAVHTSGGGGGSADQKLMNRVSTLEDENKKIKSDMKELREVVTKLQSVVNNLMKSGGDTKNITQNDVKQEKSAPKKSADDEIDLFGSDEEEEDEEAAKVREQRLKAYEEKKSKKPGPIAKSSVILDVKPWDDETNMVEMEKLVRGIEMDGLLWGASKLVPVGYGIKKLQIMCVVEDDKVSVEELQEKIEANEDYVQSVDIAAFNKI